MAGRRRNPVKTLFKVEVITNNSIVIIKTGSAMDTPAQMKQLASEMVRRNLPGVIFVRATSLDEIQVLDEASMNKAGWWRKEKTNEEQSS